MSVERGQRRRRRRRDARREKRQIRANPYVYRTIAIVVGWILVPLFRLRAVGFDAVRKERGAFLLVSNHSAVIDPFLVGCLFRRPVQFVASDSQFRSRVVSFLGGLVGVILKTKALADLDTVINGSSR